MPKAERALTDALIRQAPEILPPGRKGWLVLIREVKLGTGRPDAILAIVDREAIDERRRSRRRVPLVAYARQLECVVEGTRSRYSRSYAGRMRRVLIEKGWLTEGGDPLPVRRLIHHSLLVEAKMADWYKGIGQLMHARWAATEAALLLPEQIAHRVRRRVLNHNGLGMITADESFRLIWQVRTSARNPGLASDVWLTEIIIRAAETGDLIQYDPSPPATAE